MPMRDYLVTVEEEPILMFCYILLTAYAHLLRNRYKRVLFSFCYFAYVNKSGEIVEILIGPLLLTRCIQPWVIKGDFLKSDIFKNGWSLPENIIAQNLISKMNDTLIKHIKVNQWQGF
jgi:hypothetical protein